jgi:hypothetical protein
MNQNRRAIASPKVSKADDQAIISSLLHHMTEQKQNWVAEFLKAIFKILDNF